MNTSSFEYAIHLADNALILGQRNAEWCGHGPVLEQDIAITNISLDQIGQARLCFQYAAEMYNSFDDASKASIDYLLPASWKSFNRNLEEDDLAFLREERQYRNLLLVELPKGDWAMTVLRQFFFSAYQHGLYTALETQADERLAAIAEKSVKETAYHLRWSSEWVIRLGDGTPESRQRLEAALDMLWPFTGELFQTARYESYDVQQLLQGWTKKVKTVLDEATLGIPVQGKWYQTGGKNGIHTEYLGYLLAEMQYLQRTYPNATW